MLNKMVAFKPLNIISLVLFCAVCIIVLLLGYRYKENITIMKFGMNNLKYHPSRNRWEKPPTKYVNEDMSDGDTWQKMLSFLHLDSMGQCENIFKLAPNKSYENAIAPYFERVRAHDDIIIKTAAAKKQSFFKCVTGYNAMFKEEKYVMLQLARLPFVHTVCETGFNGGHSALLWLWADKNIKVYSFDMGEFPCAKPMAAHLQSQFPGRLEVTWGDSTKTLPKFITEHPNVKCDLMIIDGGHKYEVARQDRQNFKKMVRGGDNIIFIDNYPDRRFVTWNLGRAWEEAIRHGDIYEYFRCNIAKYNQGFTFGRFLLNS